MSQLNGDLNKLEKSFARIFILIFIIEGIIPIVLSFFYNGILLISIGIIFLILGAVLGIIFIQTGSKVHWMPHILNFSLSVLIGFVIVMILFYWALFPVSEYTAEGDVLAVQYLFVFLFTIIGLFTIWVIIILRQKKRSSKQVL